MVRGCTWSNQDICAWDVDILENAAEIPESLRVDIIGSRRVILFVEGRPTSLDQPLYELLFPSISIRARDGCSEVLRAVTGLRSVEPLHRVSAFGLVDNDGMDGEMIAEFKSKGVYALPIMSVESIYYSAEVLVAVAAQQSLTLGVAADELISKAKSDGLTMLQQPGILEHLAAKVAERTMRDGIMRAMPDRQTMINTKDSALRISIPCPYPAELDRIKSLVEAGDIDGIVSKYPIRESGVLSGLARGLRFIGRQDYERAALTRIGADKALQLQLKSKLQGLTAKLDIPS